MLEEVENGEHDTNDDESKGRVGNDNNDSEGIGQRA